MYNYELNTKDIENYFNEFKLHESHINILINNFYRTRDKELKNFSQLPNGLIHKATQLNSKLPSIINKQVAEDGTTKFLVELNDKSSVEMVLLPFYKKYTLCISSQVGCAMGCKFCFTAQQGYKRNLTVSEIIAQILIAKDFIKKHTDNTKELTNIVFMGQGEPLHNFKNLKKAIEIMTLRNGLSISEKNITVSSVGFLPGLERFNELGGVNFALSLHSANDEKRAQIIPLNQKYPLKDILKEIEKIELRKKQTVEYEYILIKDFNDSKSDALELYKVLKDRTHMINIIPFNPFPGSKLKKPKHEDIIQFKKFLVEMGLRCMIRTTKGDDILAACGQLNSKEKV